MEKINRFQGALTDVSAETEALKIIAVQEQ